MFVQNAGLSNIYLQVSQSVRSTSHNDVSSRSQAARQYCLRRTLISILIYNYQSLLLVISN